MTAGLLSRADVGHLARRLTFAPAPRFIGRAAGADRQAVFDALMVLVFTRVTLAYIGVTTFLHVLIAKLPIRSASVSTR